MKMTEKQLRRIERIVRWGPPIVPVGAILGFMLGAGVTAIGHPILMPRLEFNLRGVILIGLNTAAIGTLQAAFLLAMAEWKHRTYLRDGGTATRSSSRS